MLDEEIKDKIRKAKKEGKVVNSIEDLTCLKHPDSSFVVHGGIPNSETSPGGLNLSTYVCETCRKEGEPYPSDSIAYDCPNCGIVMGDYFRLPIHSPEGEIYEERFVCRICEKELGYNIGLHK